LGKEETGSVLDPATAGLKASNDQAQIASLLTDLLPGKALGAVSGKGALGVLVPFLKGFNKDKLAATALEKKAASASDMLREGASPDEIQKLTSLYKMPGSYPGINHPSQAQWLHNVDLDPTKPVWRQGYADEPGFLKRDQPTAPLDEILQLSTNSPRAGAYEELYRQYPQLFNLNVQALSKKDPTAYGRYYPRENTARIFGNADGIAGDPWKTFNHEFSHKIMGDTAQFQVGGFGMHPIDQSRSIPYGYDMLDELYGKVHPGIMRDVRRTLRLAENPDTRQGFINAWNQSPGEKLANFSAALDTASITGRSKPDMPSMTGTISDAIPRALGDTLWHLGQGLAPRSTPDNAKVFIDILRKRNLLE
jgi:hypothetical protein